MLSFLLDGWDQQAVSAANAILAWAAACAHVYAAVKVSGKLRVMFIGIGSLALFYSFAYWWLFFNQSRASDWSDFLRPVSILAWILAWGIEPLVLVHYMKRRASELVGDAKREAGRARKRLDELG